MQNSDAELIKSIWRATPAALASILTRNEPQPWIAAPHLGLLSDWIVDAVYGRKPRIIVNMPPRHGKSELISKWTPVWFLETFPTKQVINCGYGTSFAEEWGRKVRGLVTQFKEQLSFALSQDSRAAGRWNTTQGGGMYATGTGGGITGRGADLLIIDDPIKDAKEANSLTYRNELWRWYTDTARSRVMPGAAIILLMTRWHEDDLVGRLLKAAAAGDGEHWDVLNLPALAFDVDDPNYTPDPLGRRPGEPLWAEITRYLGMGGISAMEYLNGLMRGMSDEAWYAQYQGVPGSTVRNGNVYKSFGARNVRPVAFDPRRPLVWSMDFNVDPMCSVLCQWHEETTLYTHLTNERQKTISVLQELSLPNSCTLEACEEFVNRTEHYRKLMRGRPLHVRIYGDRSGQSRKTVGETDYIVIRDFFRGRSEFSVTMHLSKSNPAVKDRVNAVNAMLCNALGEVRTLIDPACTGLAKDFKQVQWKRDSAGNTTGQIDKSDVQRTHVSDAYGYFVEKEFGLKARTGAFAGIAQ
jgi:hypothetical protein